VSDATVIEIRLREQEVHLRTPGFESVVVRGPSVVVECFLSAAIALAEGSGARHPQGVVALSGNATIALHALPAI
jgi:hypothetical protein